MYELTTEEKRFFAVTAKNVSLLSTCVERKGATLVLRRALVSCGYNRLVIKEKQWEISAIYDAIFKARDIDLSGGQIFSTYFPQVDDLKLISAVGIISVYFFGPINDAQAVELVNDMSSSGIGIEMIQLE